MLLVLNPRPWERHKVCQWGPKSMRTKTENSPTHKSGKYDTTKGKHAKNNRAVHVANSYQAPIPCPLCAATKTLRPVDGTWFADKPVHTKGLWIFVPVTVDDRASFK